MDRKENLMRALAGESLEVIPGGFWKHFPKEFKYGKASIDRHIEFLNRSKSDVMKMMNEHLMKVSFSVEHPEDWIKFERFGILRDGYDEYVDEVREMRAALDDDDVPLFITIHGVLVSACHATEGENRFYRLDNLVTRHLKENPECTVRGLKVIAQELAELSERCIDAGADGVYYAQLGSEEERFSEDFFKTYVLPIEMELLERISAKGKTIFHVCKEHVRLRMFSDIKCDCINWAVHTSRYPLEEGRNLFKGKTLLGGFDNRDGALIKLDYDAIRKEAENIVSKVGRHGLIWGADCSLPSSIEDDEIGKVMDILHSV